MVEIPLDEGSRKRQFYSDFWNRMMNEINSISGPTVIQMDGQ